MAGQEGMIRKWLPSVVVPISIRLLAKGQGSKNTMNAIDIMAILSLIAFLLAIKLGLENPVAKILNGIGVLFAFMILFVAVGGYFV